MENETRVLFQCIAAPVLQLFWEEPKFRGTTSCPVRSPNPNIQSQILFFFSIGSRNKGKKQKQGDILSQNPSNIFSFYLLDMYML